MKLIKKHSNCFYKQLLFFLTQDIPKNHGDTLYKDLNGIILWHTNSNFIGKTVYDIYLKKSIDQLIKLDNKAINSKKLAYKLINIRLLSRKEQACQQLIINKPYFNEQGQIAGIFINAINLVKPISQISILYHKDLQIFQNNLQEILLLIHLLELQHDDNNKQHDLYTELKNFTKQSLIDYKNIVTKVLQ